MNIIKMKMRTKESFASKLLGYMLMHPLVELTHLSATHLILIGLIVAIVWCMVCLMHTLLFVQSNKAFLLPCHFFCSETSCFCDKVISVIAKHKCLTFNQQLIVHHLSINYAVITSKRSLRDLAGGHASI